MSQQYESRTKFLKCLQFSLSLSLSLSLSPILNPITCGIFPYLQLQCLHCSHPLVVWMILQVRYLSHLSLPLILRLNQVGNKLLEHCLEGSFSGFIKKLLQILLEPVNVAFTSHCPRHSLAISSLLLDISSFFTSSAQFLDLYSPHITSCWAQSPSINAPMGPFWFQSKSNILLAHLGPYKVISLSQFFFFHFLVIFFSFISTLG